MLKKLVEIDHKCFRQFKWGTLPELARFNLFYGWNGLLAETPKVMQAILEVMRKEDKEHVDRLEVVLYG